MKFSAGKSIIFSIICLLFFGVSKAQTCEGSLGDPIVFIDFGAGSNYGPPLAAGVSNRIQYAAENCPNDGYYAITNLTSGCWAFDVNWHRLKDHTGNAGGYYMLINASYEPSEFFIRRIDGLCEGTSYEFAAWLVNACGVSGILPNLTLTIETTTGTILQSYETGDIPITNPYRWEQYGFYFTTPPGVSSVVLRMRNNAPGGIGNDVGLDDISFRPVGPRVRAGVTGETGNRFDLCPDNQRALHFNSVVDECYINTAYQWQESSDSGKTWVNIAGATSPGYDRLPGPPGFYYYRVAVAPTENIGIAYCRVVSDTIIVDVPAPLHPDLGKEQYVCRNDSLLISPGIFENYRWQDGSMGPTYTVQKAGTYSVTVSNRCESASSSVAIAERVCGIFFPSAFTPNGDGKNDLFRVIVTEPVLQFELKIYDRWGRVLFSSQDPSKGWDGTSGGKAMNSGTYIWKTAIRTQRDATVQRLSGQLLLTR